MTTDNSDPDAPAHAATTPGLDPQAQERARLTALRSAQLGARGFGPVDVYTLARSLGGRT